MTSCHNVRASIFQPASLLETFLKKVIKANWLDLERFKMVLVTPEIIKDGDLLDTIVLLPEIGNLERIVIDEAHTIFRWENTFCPVYKGGM